MSVYGRRGSLVRLVYLAVSLLVCVVTLGGRLFRGRVVVLCYHGIFPAQRGGFERQMRAIRNRVRRGTPRVAITFDDAFANLHDNAVPVLRKLNIPATVFVVSDNLGVPPRWSLPPGHSDYHERTLTAEEVQALASTGVKIGSHTHTHRPLTALSDVDLNGELRTARTQLEQLVDGPVTELACPHGACDARVARAAAAAGYDRVYTLEERLVREDTAELCVGRFSMTPDTGPLEFWLTSVGAYAWLYPWRTLWRRLRRRTPVPRTLAESTT